MRVATIALFVTALLGSSISVSGTSKAPASHSHPVAVSQIR
jgi:hypothetical protein